MTWKVTIGDCLTILKRMPSDSVDLVVTSPPYEDARYYGIGFKLRGQDWVDWAVERYLECVRVSRGAVCWVVQGRTQQFRWSATPALLMADLHRAGVRLRPPPIYHRVGIPGSGGPDWWRGDYEFCICSSKGKLLWSDNTANGHPPKHRLGGAMSNRYEDGTRVNAQLSKKCSQPKLANPGNVIRCKVGGNLLGHTLAHENEAPFPESLVDPFVRCFCPPGGIVLDCFAGSGTTIAVAVKNGRIGQGIEIRREQAAIIARRMKDVERALSRDLSPAPRRKAKKRAMLS